MLFGYYLNNSVLLLDAVGRREKRLENFRMEV
jgi:hypothetical protein